MNAQRIPAMTVTPIGPPESFGCRCDGSGVHDMQPACYTPGRAPDSDGPGRFLSPWDLQGRLDEAREEGREEVACEEPHCSDGECLPLDRAGMDEPEAVAYALERIRPVPLSLPVRRALAEALDVDFSQIGTARTRKATP